MAPLRIGFIGAGDNTRKLHIPGFQAINDIELVSVTNRSKESSQRVADEFGIAKVQPSVEALLADDDIDAVCIGTWPDKHRDYTVAALEAGKHVLCEARMARNGRDGEAMLAASQTMPELVAQLVPAPFDFRLGPTIQRLIGEGALGEIIETRMRMLNGAGLAGSSLHWRHSYEISGRNTMMLGIFNEMIQRWLGNTTRVTADAAVQVTTRHDEDADKDVQIEIPDSLTVLARMENGSRTIYDISAVAGGNFDQPPGEVFVHGTEGALHWVFGDQARFAKHGEEATDLVPDEGTDRGWQVEADFVASIRESKPVELTSLRDGVRYMRFIDAVWDSWSQHRTVDILSLKASDADAARSSLIDEPIRS